MRVQSLSEFIPNLRRVQQLLGCGSAGRVELEHLGEHLLEASIDFLGERGVGALQNIGAESFHAVSSEGRVEGGELVEYTAE